MHFLMPNVFQSHREFKEWFSIPVTGMIEGNAEVDENTIKRLHKVSDQNNGFLKCPQFLVFKYSGSCEVYNFLFYFFKIILTFFSTIYRYFGYQIRNRKVFSQFFLLRNLQSHILSKCTSF